MDIKINDYIYENQMIYFIESKAPVIWKYDCRSHELKVLVDYSNVINISRAFAKIIKVNEKIYCMPCLADKIYCIDLNTLRFYELGIPDNFFNRMPRRKIIEPIRVGADLYCVCRSPHCIFVIHSETDTYETYTMRELENEHDVFLVKEKNGVLEYPFLQGSVINFDTEKKSFAIQKLFDVQKSDDINDHLFHFVYDDNGYVWGCNFKGKLFKCKNGNVEWIEMPRDYINLFHDGKHLLTGINGMIYRDGILYLILESDYRILLYNLLLKEFQWTNGPEGLVFENQATYCNFKEIKEDTFLLYDQVKNLFFVWNNKKGFFDSFSIIISTEFIVRNKHLLPYFGDFNNERANFGLVFYLDFLKLSEEYIQNESNNGGKIGKIIYDKMP